VSIFIVVECSLYGGDESSLIYFFVPIPEKSRNRNLIFGV
jgi:hypothetical protein